MGDAKRRAAEIAELKRTGSKMDKLIDAEINNPKKQRHAAAAVQGPERFLDAGKQTLLMKQAEGQTIAEFLHYVLNNVPGKLTNDMVTEILVSAHHSIVGSEVFPETETVHCYYKDRSCLKVQWLEEQGAVKVESGREIAVPAHARVHKQ